MSAHQIYNDTARIANNNGEVDRTLPGAQRTNAATSSTSTTARRKNPTDSRTFSESSNRFGALMDVSWANAAKAAVDTTLRDLRRGGEKAMQKVDTHLMSDMAGDAAAIAFSQQFTRDGKNAQYLRTAATLMGKPSSHTLLQDGSKFDTRSIPSAMSSHRENNNRLVNANASAGPARKKHAQPKRHGPSATLFPDRAQQDRGMVYIDIPSPATEVQASQPSPKKHRHIPQLPTEDYEKKLASKPPASKNSMTDREAAILANHFSGPFEASPSPITNPFSNPMDQVPLVESLRTRMITRSMCEEGTIDLVERKASNEMARIRTMDLLQNGQLVCDFIHSQINVDPENLSSPYLCKRYDYYFAKRS